MKKDYRNTLSTEEISGDIIKATSLNISKSNLIIDLEQELCKVPSDGGNHSNYAAHSVHAQFA